MDQEIALRQHVQKGDFVVVGTAPSYTDFQRIVAGLVGTSELLVAREHRFHFCVEGNEALIIWFCDGALYQRKMRLSTCLQLLDCLEKSGFHCEDLN